MPVFNNLGSVVGTIDVKSELESAFSPKVQTLLEACAEIIGAATASIPLS